MHDNQTPGWCFGNHNKSVTKWCSTSLLEVSPGVSQRMSVGHFILLSPNIILIVGLTRNPIVVNSWTQARELRYTHSRQPSLSAAKTSCRLDVTTEYPEPLSPQHSRLTHIPACLSVWRHHFSTYTPASPHSLHRHIQPRSPVWSDDAGRGPVRDLCRPDPGPRPQGGCCPCGGRPRWHHNPTFALPGEMHVHQCLYQCICCSSK